MKTFKFKAEYSVLPTYSIEITYLTGHGRITKTVFAHNDLSYTNDVLWNLLNKDFSEVEITEKEYNNLVNVNIIQNISIYSLSLEEKTKEKLSSFNNS